MAASKITLFQEPEQEVKCGFVSLDVRGKEEISKGTVKKVEQSEDNKRHLAALEIAMVEEERLRLMEDFEPLPAYLEDETEKKVITCRPASTLFINNLPSSINESGVTNVFREFGDILHIYIRRTRMRTTNWAKVSFATKQEAANAIKKVDKQPPLFLHVAFDRPQEAKDCQKEKERAALDFGNECLSMFQKVESEKQKILNSEQFVQGIAKSERFNETTKAIAKVDTCNQTTGGGKLNLIEKDLSVIDGNNQTLEKSKDGLQLDKEENEVVEPSDNKKENIVPGPCNQNETATDLGVETANVDDKNVWEEAKAHGTSCQITPANCNVQSSVVFGNPLFVPYMSPCPCVHCSKPGRILCSRCHVWYCSQACQLQNWPTHKDHCRQIQVEEGIALLGEPSRSSGSRSGENIQ